MSTLTRADVSEISQQLDRASRIVRNQTALLQAQASGDMAGQLSALRHIADAKYGVTGRAELIVAVREIEDVAGKLGYRDDGSQFTAPETQSMAKSMAPRPAPRPPAASRITRYVDALEPLAKSSTGRAAEFTTLRREVMQAMVHARARGDFHERLELIGMRDRLTQQAAAEGLTLGDAGQFVASRSPR